ncbi:MAG TPA: hypothetical protein VMY59_03950 [Candidatus Thermoplasmatota archaeon]|nr:hypothetical protein [Candidatus Thermoplasmatota archaeon]
MLMHYRTTTLQYYNTIALQYYYTITPPYSSTSNYARSDNDVKKIGQK